MTIQTFIEWKTNFDAEMAKKKLKEMDVKEKDTGTKKLTGKELFMCDKTLNDSDLTFDEGNGSVTRIELIANIFILMFRLTSDFFVLYSFRRRCCTYR